MYREIHLHRAWKVAKISGTSSAITANIDVVASLKLITLINRSIWYALVTSRNRIAKSIYVALCNCSPTQLDTGSILTLPLITTFLSYRKTFHLFDGIAYSLFSLSNHNVAVSCSLRAKKRKEKKLHGKKLFRDLHLMCDCIRLWM